MNSQWREVAAMANRGCMFAFGMDIHFKDTCVYSLMQYIDYMFKAVLINSLLGPY